MDRNEQNLKIEELKTAMANRDFEKAVDVANALELRKIKDNNFLSLVADAYEYSHNYDEAKKALLIAYENTNAGRQLAYRLCLVSIKMKEFGEAREYYEDFVEMAPRDTARYVLKYKMEKAKNAPIEKLIKTLEEYVNLDMEEKWAYELAKLYDKAGNREKCIDMCNEICLWFSEGKYVSKAIELKGGRLSDSIQESNEEQDEVLQEISDDVKAADENKAYFADIEELPELEEDFSDIKIKTSVNDKFNTMEIQSVIADGMKEVEIEENANIHEGMLATKIAPDITNDNEEYIKSEDTTNNASPQGDNIEEIKDIQGVEDILRQLQARGILKEETVRQAVNIIDEAGKNSKPEEKEVSTLERWEEDSLSSETTKEEIKSEDTVASDATQYEVLAECDDKVEDNEVEADIVEAEEAKDEKVEADIAESEDETEKAEADMAEDEDETEKAEADIAEAEEAETEKVAVDTGNLPDAKVVDGVPVLDLDFETTKHEMPDDTTAEVTKEEMPDDTTAEVTKEEMPDDATAEVTKEEMPDDTTAETTKMHSDKQLSVNVEIISGADWKQDETTRKPVDNLIIADVEPKQESVEEKASTQRFELNTKLPKVESDSEKNQKHEIPVLTEEELATFKNYLNVEGFATNIKEVLNELIVNYSPNGKSTEGNVIIMGSEKTGKTTLAIETIKLVNKKRGRRNRKLAKINASILNRKGFRNSLNRLLGSDLIIENAHMLGAMTLSEIIDVTGMYTDDMLIILEGETEPMEKMLSESARLANVFNHVIRIREYDIKEWVEYGKRYAKEQGCVLDEVASLAFYKAIDDFFGTNKGIGQNDVETIMDDAIDKSRRIKRKISGIFSSKKNEDGMYVLVESDFNVK